MKPLWTISSGTFSKLAGPPPVPEAPPATPAPVRWAPVDAPFRTQAGETHLRFLHVAEQGSVLRKVSSRLVVTKHEKLLLEVPLIKLQGVLVYGNIQISTQCLRSLLGEGVWVSLFSRTGAYRGRLQPPCERGGRLRMRQWERTRDADFCLRFARSAVRGKLLAQLKVVRANAQNHLAETLGDDHAIIRQTLDRLETATDLASLRGMEGTATRAYFAQFRRCNRSKLPFDGRVKQGATDPVNCLLNFGYTLLTRELDGLLEAAGLDPAAGFYHVPGEDRPALACDWVEEFRHGVIDRLVISLINTQRIQASDFEEHTEKGGLRMKPNAIRTFIQSYESVLTRPAAAGSEEQESRPPYRETFLDRLGAIVDAINEGPAYRNHLER